jgi:hypothetical protein
MVITAIASVLKGDGAFEKWFMEVFTKLDTSIQDSASDAALVGKAAD